MTETKERPAPLLASWVKAIDLIGGTMEVTLLVRGARVTGQVIPALEYMRGVQAEMVAGDSLSVSTRQVIGGFWKDVLTQIPDPSGTPEQQETWSEKWDPSCVHLRDAAIGDAPERMPFFRVRLLSIDGFAIGKISPPET